MDAARRSGILHDDDALDLGDHLDTDVAGRIAARRGELEGVQARLTEAEEADKDRGNEEGRYDTANSELIETERKSTAAADTLSAVRTRTGEELDDYLKRWTGSGDTNVLRAEDHHALRAATASAGAPDTDSLHEVFHTLTDQRRTLALAHVESLKPKHEATTDALRTLREERDLVAAEGDDAPAPGELRSASRDTRPGAPLWQLVRFAEHVTGEHAAALEGALHAAGLLTAWLHLDPKLTDQALRDQTADAYLLPLPIGQRPAGRTLADVLVVEDQPHVDSSTIQAVLASITVADDSPTGDATAATPVVTTGSHYRLGVQLGAHPKSRPEYIGATARAARRRERLRRLEESIAAAETELAGLEEQRCHAQEAFDDFHRARTELPRTQAITDALHQVALMAEKAADARRRLTEARTLVDRAIARAHEKQRQLRHAATAARLPTGREELNAVAHAIADFAEAGRALSDCRSRAEDADRDITGRNELIDDNTQSCMEQAEALQTRQDEFAVQAARLHTQEATLAAPLRQILLKIADAEGQLEDEQGTYNRAKEEAEKQRDRFLTADNDVKHVREALTTAIGEHLRAARALEPYARPDLLGLLESDTDTQWLPTEIWPTPEQAVQQLMNALTTPEAALDGHQAARSIVPPSVATLIDALDQASHGRQITPSLLKSATTRISTAIGTLESALLESDQGYHLEWEQIGDIIVARVTDSEGPAPVADFARRLAEQLADQRMLLEDKERTVLEDGLLTGLAQQIHERTIAARDLVTSMDADTRSKPMSSGATVGIRWVVCDALTDSQRAVNKLLDKDASSLGPTALAELRSHLRGQIRARAAADHKKSYQQVIAEVLDYRTWRTFELRLFRSGMSEQEKRKGELLTKAKHGVMSGGEKSASIHLPLFAAAHAQYSSAYSTCPRLIALDEAFAGIDEQYRPDLLALTAKFDLDLFMTGYDLWITYPEVPQISHYDMKHDEASHTVSAMLLVWDGEQILDDLGYSGSNELAAELLGFTPGRHLPTEAGLLDDLTEEDPASDTAEAGTV
jgi:hypothetical protein